MKGNEFLNKLACQIKEVSDIKKIIKQLIVSIDLAPTIWNFRWLREDGLQIFRSFVGANAQFLFSKYSGEIFENGIFSLQLKKI